MSTKNNVQQGNSNTAASGTNFEDPTVDTDEGNNLNSRDSRSSTSKKAMKLTTHLLTAQVLPVQNQLDNPSFMRKQSFYEEDKDEAEISQKFSITASKNFNSTTERCAKKKF